MKLFGKRVVSISLALAMVLGTINTTATVYGTVTDDNISYYEKKNDNSEFVGEGYTVSFDLTDNWSTGYNAIVTIENTGDKPIENWKLMMKFQSEITSVWNAEIESYTEDVYVIKNATWNQDIAIGDKVQFGINGKGHFEEKPNSYQIVGNYIVVSEKNYQFDYSVTSDWKTGFNGSISIKNESEIKIEDWLVEFDYDREITNIWNATIIKKENNHYVIKNADHNSNIKANNKITFGFSGTKGSTNDKPKNVKLFTHNSIVLDLTDTDEDGLPDFYEERAGLDKNNIDSDNDGLPDGYEIFTTLTYPNKIDSNGNGVSDADEDFDEDGLSNIKEYLLKINPKDSDTDGDGMKDAVELEYQMNPNDQDTLDDGIIDGERVFDIKRICEKTDSNNIQPSISITIKGSQIDSFVSDKLENSDPMLNENIPGYLGNGYEFLLDGKFEKAELSFEIPWNLINDVNINPTIYYWNEETQLLEEVDNQKIHDNVVSVELQHFSKYILVDKNEYNQYAFKLSIKAPSDEMKLKKNFDVVFSLDESGSIYTSDFRKMKNACINLLDYLKENDRVSVYTFDDTVQAVSSFETKDEASNRLSNLVQHNGMTAIYDAAYMATAEFENNSRVDASKIIILLTDGFDNWSNKTYTEAINYALDNSVIIYTIGVGSSVSSSILSKMSESTGGQYFHINNFSQLNAVFEDIIEDADLYKDSDGDGVSDYHEKKIAAGEMQIGTGESLNLCSNMDYMSADSDGDGLTDGEEIKITKNEADNNYYVYLYSNPCSKDTDKDGYDDFVEAYIGSSSITKKNYLGFNNDFSNMEIMPGFKLNNWYDWQEIIKEDAWNYIHNAVQADVVARYAPNITAEHTIKNVGRCDLYRSARKEMWEVKPSSYSKEPKQSAGIAQLKRYISAEPGAKIGGSYITNNTFTLADKYVVNYYNAQNGLIIYNFEKKDKQKQEEPVAEPEKEYDYQYEPKTSPLDELVYWGQIGAGIGLVAATLAEDVFSGGVGVADDAASFSIAYELIFGW